MGLDYKLPDLTGKMISAKTVCEHDGQVVAASALKMQAEAYLWVAPDLNPALKWDAIRMMQREILKQAMKIGIEQLVAYVPDCLRFGKRLKKLNWEQARAGWTAWVLEVTKQ